jgi:branched-chain amino acid aminotransferase
VFFIKGDEIITPPGKQVLLGITRQKTIACANRLKLKVTEQEIHLDGLIGFDAAFITGTSPKILPVNEVDGHSFDANNKVLRSLMIEFDKIIQEDLQKRVRESG